MSKTGPYKKVKRKEKFVRNTTERPVDTTRTDDSTTKRRDNELPETHTDEIEKIFDSRKSTKKVTKPSSKESKPSKVSTKRDRGEIEEWQGRQGTTKKRRYTEEGLKIYTLEELGISNKGGSM